MAGMHAELAVVAELALDLLVVDLQLPACLPARPLRPSRWHLLDAAVVIASLVLELALKGTDKEVAALLIVFRLWRIIRVMHGVAEVSGGGHGATEVSRGCMLPPTCWPTHLHPPLQAVEVHHEGEAEEREHQLAELQRELDFHRHLVVTLQAQLAAAQRAAAVRQQQQQLPAAAGGAGGEWAGGEPDVPPPPLAGSGAALQASLQQSDSAAIDLGD